MKRFLSVILAALMVIVSVGIMPESASAAVKAPAMTKKSVSIKTGKRTTVGLKAASIKNGWTISKATVVNKSVATVGKSAKKITITGKNAGNTSVKVVAKNGANKKNLSVKVKVSKATVAVNSVSVDVSAELKVGESKYLVATVYPSDATNKNIRWSSSNPSIVTVDSYGMIRGVAVGAAYVSATANNGKSSSCYVLIKAADVPATDIKLDATSKDVFVGESFTLKATLTPSNSNSTITWTSDKTDIATVDSAGKVTGVKAGTAYITATANGRTARCTVTVKAKVDATDIKIKNGSTELKNGDTIDATPGSSITLTASVTPATATSTVIWETTDTAKTYSTLSSSSTTAVITCTKETPANTPITITAKTSNGKSVTCKIVIKKKVDATGISLSPKAVTIAEKETVQLTATLTPADSTSKITWSSGNTAIATVDANGKVTGVKAGTTTITAKTDNGKSATCDVTVKAADVAATGIKLDKTANTIKVDETFTLTATLEPTGANSAVTWKSSNEAVATVDSSGKVTGKAVGKADITATSNGKEAKCTVTVEAKPVEKAKSILLSCTTGGAINQSSINLTASQNEEFVLTAIVDPITKASDVEWTVSADGIVAITPSPAKGAAITVKCTNIGTVTITAKIDDVTATCTVNITT